MNLYFILGNLCVVIIYYYYVLKIKYFECNLLKRNKLIWNEINIRIIVFVLCVYK